MLERNAEVVVFSCRLAYVGLFFFKLKTFNAKQKGKTENGMYENATACNKP